MAKSVSVQLDKILTEYDQRAKEVVQQSAQEAAEIATRQLKSTSPRGSAKGRHYASGWRIKAETDSSVVTFTVHNSAKPGLTHLLEKGHVSRNQYGYYGRVGARVHIAPAAEAAEMKFLLRVQARLRSIG